MVKMSGEGETSTRERQNQLQAEQITFKAGQGVLQQVGQREGESLSAHIDELASQPCMAWLKQFDQMPDVQRQAVQEAFDE